jgi:RNA polymerase nonessential primary-like sigma factor
MVFCLDQGAERFDPSRGYKFSTYVYYWVRQSIVRAIFDQGRTIRLPVYLHELQSKVSLYASTLKSTLGLIWVYLGSTLGLPWVLLGSNSGLPWV